MVARVLVKSELLEKQIARAVKDYPFALSRALSITVKQCRNELRREFASKLKDPKKSTINNVSMRFPNVSQVRQGDATAFVFVRQELLDAIHPQVFGGRVTQTAGTSSRSKGTDGFVITPVNLRLNRFGNIANIRKKLAKLRSDKTNYLDVPIGNRDRNTIHLTPGLYKRVNRKRRRAARRPATRRTRRRSTAKPNTLLLLALYSTERDYKAILPYHAPVIRCYERWFPGLLAVSMRKWGIN